MSIKYLLIEISILNSGFAYLCFENKKTPIGCIIQYYLC